LAGATFADQFVLRVGRALAVLARIETGVFAGRQVIDLTATIPAIGSGEKEKEEKLSRE
jgi:hypothetical protein